MLISLFHKCSKTCTHHGVTWWAPVYKDMINSGESDRQYLLYSKNKISVKPTRGRCFSSAETRTASCVAACVYNSESAAVARRLADVQI